MNSVHIVLNYTVELMWVLDGAAAASLHLRNKPTGEFFSGNVTVR